jgi:hypothetical protein
MYVFNDCQQDRELVLQPSFKTKRIWDLRENRPLEGVSFTIAANDTKFFRLEETGRGSTVGRQRT